jgi:hypothetical protein
MYTMTWLNTNGDKQHVVVETADGVHELYLALSRLYQNYRAPHECFLWVRDSSGSLRDPSKGIGLPPALLPVLLCMGSPHRLPVLLDEKVKPLPRP